MITRTASPQHAESAAPWDVLVIGAGPAGATAARQLALMGRRVALVERRRFPRPKVCGGCLSRRALDWLDVAGLDTLVADQGGVPLHTFRVASGGRKAELTMPQGAAVCRETFDMALSDAAIAAGAAWWSPVRATVVPSHSDGDMRVVRCESEQGKSWEMSARVIVVADGLGHPSLAECGEFVDVVPASSRLGAATTLAAESLDISPGVIAMHVGAAGYVGLVRMHDARIHLAAALDPAAVRTARGPREVVAEILAATGDARVDLPASDAWRGTLPLTRRLTRPAGERLLVVGDAAGYLEPFTGEGIAWAIGGGRLVATLVERALAQGWSRDIEQSWCATQSRIQGRQRFWCRVLTALARRPRLSRWAVQAVAAWPVLTRPILRQLNRPLANPRTLLS